MCHRSARSKQEFCRDCGYRLALYERKWVILDSGKARQIKKFIMDLV